MLKGTVKGSVWATKRVEDVPHGAFLEVELEGGGSIVAFDILGSGVGERVLVATGSVAASRFAPAHPPIDALIIGLLDRHASGDWGDLDANDKAANDADHSQAEGRLFSSYATEKHGTIWVITEDLRGEGDGPKTTVLFPEDY